EVTTSIPVPKKKLNLNVNITKPPDSSLEELIQNSKQFPKEYPITSVLCSNLLENNADINKEILEHHVNSTYPLLHESALHLYIDFLEYKKKHGSKIEKEMYANMTIVDLVQRIVQKRALVFVGRFDHYTLLSGETGAGDWEKIGTDEECPPLVLKDCLSYDEVKLSAFLSVTSHSVFINDGNRKNCGVPESVEGTQRHGVVVGMIGTRLAHGPVMEFQEIIVMDEQNTTKNGYGNSGKDKRKQIWAEFYGVQKLPLYEEVVNSRRENRALSSRFKKLHHLLYFDNEIYAKRIAIAAETLLLEAESRAAAENKKAYVHVVGLGLGVWLISTHQDQVYLDAFALCLRNLIHALPHISDADFAWFRDNTCGGVQDGGIIGEGDNGIKIHFSKRPPHTKLDDPNKLLVVSYAWDANTFPGNEYWDGSLKSSGDPANACSTQVTELHNAYVNSRKVCGENLHIASREWGVLHVSDYCKRRNDSST
ncbi:hypothetical protein C0J52_13618, partial [Blattella germanica]